MDVDESPLQDMFSSSHPDTAEPGKGSPIKDSDDDPCAQHTPRLHPRCSGNETSTPATDVPIHWELTLPPPNRQHERHFWSSANHYPTTYPRSPPPPSFGIQPHPPPHLRPRVPDPIVLAPIVDPVIRAASPLALEACLSHNEAVRVYGTSAGNASRSRASDAARAEALEWVRVPDSEPTVLLSVWQWDDAADYPVETGFSPPTTTLQSNNGLAPSDLVTAMTFQQRRLVSHRTRLSSVSAVDICDVPNCQEAHDAPHDFVHPFAYPPGATPPQQLLRAAAAPAAPDRSAAGNAPPVIFYPYTAEQLRDARAASGQITPRNVGQGYRQDLAPAPAPAPAPASPVQERELKWVTFSRPNVRRRRSNAQLVPQLAKKPRGGWGGARTRTRPPPQSPPQSPALPLAPPPPPPHHPQHFAAPQNRGPPQRAPEPAHTGEEQPPICLACWAAQFSNSHEVFQYMYDTAVWDGRNVLCVKCGDRGKWQSNYP